MNTNLLHIVKQITARYGEAVLADPARLKAFFGDLAKNEPKPLRLAFGRCIEEGAYNALKTAPDAAERAERKAAIAQRLRDEHGLDITLCGEALDVLEAAVYGTASSAGVTPQQTVPFFAQGTPPTPMSQQYQAPQYAPSYAAPQTAIPLPAQSVQKTSAGFIIGVLNVLQVTVLYLCRNSITLPEEDRQVIIAVWLVITIVLAITGFCISLSDAKKSGAVKGYGIAGAALNGLIILPALFFLLLTILNGGASNNRRKVHHLYIH